MVPLVLLLGPMASGKTSLCKSLFKTMADAAMKPFAIIQENRRNPEGYPLELRLVELPGGEERFLAARGVFKAEQQSGEGNGRELNPFVFEKPAFVWACAKINQALAEGCGALIVDEIGPLEVFKGDGLMPALEEAANAEGLLLILSLRPSLEEALLGRLPKLTARPRMRVLPDRFREKNELLFLSKDIIRHCQDKK